MSVSTEAALILPALVMFVLLVLAVATDTLRQQTVGAAAANAARAASLERGPVAAKRAARDAAAAALAEDGMRCQQLTVRTDVAGLNAPLGTPSSVTVRIECAAELPGLPRPRTYRAERNSPVDTFRGR